jgi:hypothetical protein
MKDTSKCIKYRVLISLDYNVKALQQKPLSFKLRSVLPGIRRLKHCLREGVQKSQTGPCSNQKHQKIIIIQGYRTYVCPLLESERCMNEQGNFENWLFHMHFVCPRRSGFPKTERTAIKSKVSVTQYPFSSKEKVGGRGILPSDVGLNVEKFYPNVTAITEHMDQ